MKYKDDFMSVTLTVIGGLLIAATVFGMTFISGLDDPLINFIGNGMLIYLSIPMLAFALLILGIARIIEILYRIQQNIENKD